MLTCEQTWPPHAHTCAQEALKITFQTFIYYTLRVCTPAGGKGAEKPKGDRETTKKEKLPLILT